MSCTSLDERLLNCCIGSHATTLPSTLNAAKAIWEEYEHMAVSNLFGYVGLGNKTDQGNFFLKTSRRRRDDVATTSRRRRDDVVAV